MQTIKQYNIRCIHKNANTIIRAPIKSRTVTFWYRTGWPGLFWKTDMKWVLLMMMTMMCYCCCCCCYSSGCYYDTIELNVMWCLSAGLSAGGQVSFGDGWNCHINHRIRQSAATWARERCSQDRGLTRAVYHFSVCRYAAYLVNRKVDLQLVLSVQLLSHGIGSEYTRWLLVQL